MQVIESPWVFTGKRFRIKIPALALDENNGVVTLLIDSIITVIDDRKPKNPLLPNPLLRVVCENQRLLMFEQDIRQSTEEVPDTDPPSA